MRNNIFIATIATMAICLASCGEEEDIAAVDNSGTGNVKPENVIVRPSYVQANFSNWLSSRYAFTDDGLLSEVYSVDYETDENGNQIMTEELSMRYEYGNGTATIYVNEPPYDWSVQTICQFEIGANGFANSMVQVYTGSGERDYWRFFYDTDGHLVKINASGDECTLRYENGNLTSYTDYSDGEDEAIFTYGDANTLGYMPYISNPGSFGPSYQEVWWGYIAGILGKPSAEMPSSMYLDYHGRYSNREYNAIYYYDPTSGLLDDIIWQEVQ